MKYSWDIKILDPIVVLFLFGLLFQIIKKNKYLKKDLWFLLQQTCFWIATFLVVSGNENFITFSMISKKYAFWIIMIFSTSFYSIFNLILANFISQHFENRKIWFFTTHIVAFISLIVFVISPTFAGAIILSLGISFSAASASQYFLFYSENYHKRYFPFFVVSILFSIILFSKLLTFNISNLLNLYFDGNNDENFAVITVLIGFILFIFSFLILLNIKNDKTMFGYSYEQRKYLQAFLWPRAIIIFIILFVVSVIENIGNGVLFDLILKQNTYTYFNHNSDIINLFSRLSSLSFTAPEIIVAILTGGFLFKNFGVKYSTGIGLVFLFIYYALMAFTTNPFILLILNIFNSIGYTIIFVNLLSLLFMWNSRTFRKNLPTIGSIIIAITHFSFKYIINITIQKLIPSLEEGNNTYVSDDKFTYKLNSDTTLLFAGLGIFCLFIWILFYFLSSFILGEYNERNVDCMYIVNKQANISNKKKL